MSTHITDQKPWEHLESLALTEKPSEVYGLDGGALWRVADGHFVLLVCTDDHDGNPVQHRGPAMLLRVLPHDWVCFAVYANPDHGYEAQHYGPELPDLPEPADAH